MYVHGHSNGNNNNTDDVRRFSRKIPFLLSFTVIANKYAQYKCDVYDIWSICMWVVLHTYTYTDFITY